MKIEFGYLDKDGQVIIADKSATREMSENRFQLENKAGHYRVKTSFINHSRKHFDQWFVTIVADNTELKIIKTDYYANIDLAKKGHWAMVKWAQRQSKKVR